MVNLFKRRNIDQYTDSLAAYLPGGKLFASKSIQNSNFRKLLRGMAGELFRSNGLLIEYNQEILPDKTNKFLSEWESAVGIPDDCFTGTGTNDERRSDILVKLASLGVQTDRDFVNLAAVFGKEVMVFPLSERAFPPYAVPFLPVGFPEARFTIVVESETLLSSVPAYDVPFDLIVGDPIIECLFRKLKPANCEIIFRNSN